jgi:hypothetical protein
MSDLEIKALAARLRNQISSTGIGQYKLSATNPAASGETWVQVGGTILDKRNTLADIVYNANYVGDYAASWDKTWTGIYTKQYEAIYEGVFTKQFQKAYIGQYEKHYNKQKDGDSNTKLSFAYFFLFWAVDLNTRYSYYFCYCSYLS